MLFAETHELWKKGETDSGMQTPKSFEFHVPFPLKFVDKDFAHPLVVPPSFNVNFTGQPSFSARNEYTLSVIVNIGRPASGSRTRHDRYVHHYLPCAHLFILCGPIALCYLYPSTTCLAHGHTCPSRHLSSRSSPHSRLLPRNGIKSLRVYLARMGHTLQWSAMYATHSNSRRFVY